MLRAAAVIGVAAAGSTSAQPDFYDYSKFLPKGDALNSASYEDYSQYTKQCGGADYSKYIQQGGFSSVPAVAASSPELLLAADTPAPGTTEAPMPAEAKHCTTKKELKAWLEGRKAQIKKYVPEEYQTYASKDVEAEYNKTIARIEAPPATTDAPAAPALVLAAAGPDSPAQVTAEAHTPSEAKHCTTKKELEAWREARGAQIKKYVPEACQAYANKDAAAAYAKNLARIEAPATTAPPAKKYGGADYAKYMQQGGSSDVSSDVASSSEAPTAHPEAPAIVLGATTDAPVAGSTEAPAPAHARDCTTEKELNAWEQAKLAQIKDYVPEAYRAYAKYGVEAEYKKNVARIEAPSTSALAPSAAPVAVSVALAASTEAPATDEVPGAAPTDATDCATKQELKAWRKVQEAHVADDVPEAYRSYANQGIKSEYDKHLARIEAPTASTSEGASGVVVAAVESRNTGGVGALAYIGAALGALLVAAFGSRSRRGGASNGACAEEPRFTALDA